MPRRHRFGYKNNILSINISLKKSTLQKQHQNVSVIQFEYYKPQKILHKTDF